MTAIRALRQDFRRSHPDLWRAQTEAAVAFADSSLGVTRELAIEEFHTRAAIAWLKAGRVAR